MTIDAIYRQAKLGNTHCLCCLEQPMSTCCEPYIRGIRSAATAVMLMRSRYVAYCMRNRSYLLKTWHPDTRPSSVEFSAQDDTIWTGLQIVKVVRGGESDSVGEVSFEARYLSQGRVSVLAENSRFQRVDNAWMYVDGSPTLTAEASKVTGNQRCRCGRRGRFRGCCG